MNAFQLKEWWRYRRAAKGRHGVHSPFVYRFIEEGLRPGAPKNVRAGLRSLGAKAHEYAHAKTLFCCLRFLRPRDLYYIPSQNSALLEAASGYAGVAISNESSAVSAQCILLGGSDADKLERMFSANAGRMKDGLVFIVADIHASAHNALLWLRLREDARVNLSIDLWHVGLLFSRAVFKERQHFVLKYPA